MEEKMKRYVVYGDLASGEAAEQYPTITMCNDCAKEAEIVAVEGPAAGPCDVCGADDE